MRYFKIQITNGEVDTNGVDVIYTFAVDSQTAYAVCTGAGKDSWAEITEAEFKQVVPTIPASVAPVTLDDLQQQISALGQGLAALALK